VKTSLEKRFEQVSIWAARILLGAVFIYAAMTKIMSPQDFADSVAAYQILPFSVINLLALGLPFFELVCGLLIIIGLFLRIGVLGILTMLAIFIVAQSVGLLRGLSIDCGCFGAHSWLDTNPVMALLRDSIFLAMAIYVYKYCANEQRT
jgi:putative oxidoreductase